MCECVCVHVECRSLLMGSTVDSSSLIFVSGISERVMCMVAGGQCECVTELVCECVSVCV